ncbi:unnamed protein product [Closterium sp. NIES-65]|nr:unnamed protein product [Closterium sp. NIES-65]
MPRTVIMVPVPSVQGSEQSFDRSVDPAGSNATMAPPPLCPSLAAGLAPVGPEVGPSADERRVANENKENAIDGNNMYGMAFLAGGAYGMDINYDVEYLDEAHEEEGGLRSIIINLGVTLTRPKGKVVDKDLLMVECMSIMEGYLGLYIVRDRPNKTFLMHQNAYVAKVQQRSFKGAPPKKQPITPLSYTSFVMEDAELLADRTMTDRFAAGAHLRTDAHSHELFRTLSYWAASADMGLLFKGGPKS